MPLGKFSFWKWPNVYEIIYSSGHTGSLIEKWAPPFEISPLYIRKSDQKSETFLTFESRSKQFSDRGVCAFSNRGHCYKTIFGGNLEHLKQQKKISQTFCSIF